MGLEEPGNLNEKIDLNAVIDKLPLTTKIRLSKIKDPEQQKEFFRLLDTKVKQEYTQSEKEKMEQYDKYMEEGKKYINEDKWQEWINYESMYKDALLGLSVLQRIVEIMRMLDEGKYYEKIRDKMINEWQCEGYNYIRSAVIRFSKHGEEFGEKSKNRYKTKNRYKPRHQILEEINFSIKSLLGKNK